METDFAAPEATSAELVRISVEVRTGARASGESVTKLGSFVHRRKIVFVIYEILDGFEIVILKP